MSSSICCIRYKGLFAVYFVKKKFISNIFYFKINFIRLETLFIDSLKLNLKKRINVFDKSFVNQDLLSLFLRTSNTSNGSVHIITINTSHSFNSRVKFLLLKKLLNFKTIHYEQYLLQQINHGLSNSIFK